MKRHVLVLLPIIFVTAGQTFAKYGAQEIGETNTIINSYIILGYTMLIVRGFIWVFILKKVKLSFAYPLMSVTYIIILAIAHLLFNEDITFYNLLGCGFIIGGVTFVSLGEITDRIDLNE